MVRSSQRRLRLWAILIAIAAVIAAGVVYALNSSSTPHPLTSPSPAAISTPTTYASLGAASGQATGGPTMPGGLPAGLPGSGQLGSSTGGGTSSYGNSLSAHTVVLRLWADVSLPAYGYWWIPSTKSYGNLSGQLTSWSHTATAYGSPKFGMVYATSDYRGVVVHCSVSVDGQVKATGQTHGPYGYVVCAA